MLLPAIYMPPKCNTYATHPNYSIYVSEESKPIYMQHMNSLTSTTWCAVLYTGDNDANTNNDAACMH